MDTRTMINQALLRADLPFNSEHTDLALGYLNGNVERFWYKDRANFRTSWGSIDFVQGADEYVLNKWCDEIVKYSLRGPEDNSRYLQYLDPVEFFRLIRDRRVEVDRPYIYTYGQMVGIDRQMTSVDEIECYSTLANKTGGTVNVTAGSIRIKGSGTDFKVTDEGLRFKKEGDTDSYTIAKVIDTETIELDTKYRGFTTSDSNYKVGDVGVLVNVTGIVGGQVASETIELDGENVVKTTRIFTSLNSVNKDRLTGGAIVAREEASNSVVATLAPSEYEIERKTIRVWPQPSTAENMKYRFYMHHPELRHVTDRLLIPKKYHDGILAMLESDLLTWANKEVPVTVATRITRAWLERDNDVNSTELEDMVPESDETRPLGNYYTRDFDFLGSYDF